MLERTLGKSGASLTEVGLGCWQFGGDFGPISEGEVRTILEAAESEGIRFLDTADVYGGGRSESLIGAFLRDSSETYFVATKVGRNGNLFPDKYSKDAVRTSIEQSRDRLGVESIDLIQLHCVPVEVLRAGDIFDWLRDFQSDGLIKDFGASVESVEEGLICLVQEGLTSLQVIFNIFRQKPAIELFPAAVAARVGIIVRLPLASGLLAGKYSADTRFAESDHRSYNRDGAAFNVGETFAGLPFGKGVELADRLKTDVPDGVPMATWAQRWILDHPAVTSIITGASKVEQVRGNAAAAETPALTPEMHAKLRAFHDRDVAPFIRGPY
jgi:aryl-alcohol dehydrogenase-like predicted oxidoreductase